jgi:hypothetical protein
LQSTARRATGEELARDGATYLKKLNPNSVLTLRLQTGALTKIENPQQR